MNWTRAMVNGEDKLIENFRRQRSANAGYAMIGSPDQRCERAPNRDELSRIHLTGLHRDAAQRASASAGTGERELQC